MTAVRWGQCPACYDVGFCELATGLCFTCTDAAAEPPAAVCDCGAAAADPVSTRRDGGPGHADYCAVRGRP